MANIDVIIKNLSDGDIYTDEEIAKLTDTTKEYVRGILNNPSIHKTCGDGSGVIYYMDIKYDTIVDGVDFRNTVYCAKCNLYCKGCHNSQSWDIKNGNPISVDELARLLLENGNNITFSGGECSLQANAFIELAKKIKKQNKSIWLYSGRTFDDLINDRACKELLEYVDILVDGQFIESLKNVDLLFKGSSNQRIIDLNKTRKYRKIMLWKR